jgi:hypothetical protein
VATLRLLQTICMASHTRVSAPFSGLRDIGLSIVITKSISRPLLRLKRFTRAKR